MGGMYTLAQLGWYDLQVGLGFRRCWFERENQRRKYRGYTSPLKFIYFATKNDRPLSHLFFY